MREEKSRGAFPCSFGQGKLHDRKKPKGRAAKMAVVPFFLPEGGKVIQRGSVARQKGGRPGGGTVVLPVAKVEGQGRGTHIRGERRAVCGQVLQDQREVSFWPVTGLERACCPESGISWAVRSRKAGLVGMRKRRAVEDGFSGEKLRMLPRHEA